MLVPMTSAMGIFTRESLIPPWESSLDRPEIRAYYETRRGNARHICPVIRLDYIFHRRIIIHNAVLCVAEREEYV